MPKCPKCGQEIDKLYRYRPSNIDVIIGIDESGEVVMSASDQFQMKEPDEYEYICPKCDETVTQNEEEAIRFLKEGVI